MARLTLSDVKSDRELLQRAQDSSRNTVRALQDWGIRALRAHEMAAQNTADIEPSPKQLLADEMAEADGPAFPFGPEH